MDRVTIKFIVQRGTFWRVKRDTINNNSKTTDINWYCPRQTKTYGQLSYGHCIKAWRRHDEKLHHMKTHLSDTSALAHLGTAKFPLGDFVGERGSLGKKLPLTVL